jgi:hypothetical protein
MDKIRMIQELGALAQLDIDAVHAYGQAIEKIDLPVIREHMMRCRDDHRRHANELSVVIRELGGEPPEFTPDLKGYLISGFTSLRSMAGTEGALKAMHTNERLTNKKYADACARDWSLSSAAGDLVMKNRKDERLHIEYIENALDNRAWETPLT